MFDLVFQRLSPSRGQGCRLGRKQSASVWRGCHRGPLLGGPPRPPVRLSITPPAEGSPSESSLAHFGLSGAPNSSRRQPNLSPLECEFSDLRLQIAHLQRCQSRNTISLGNIFPPRLMLCVLQLSPQCPQVFQFFQQR